MHRHLFFVCFSVIQQINKVGGFDECSERIVGIANGVEKVDYVFVNHRFLIPFVCDVRI